VSTSPLCTATCSGTAPCASLASAGALCASSSSTMSGCRLWAAMCSGVRSVCAQCNACRSLFAKPLKGCNVPICASDGRDVAQGHAARLQAARQAIPGSWGHRTDAGQQGSAAPTECLLQTHPGLFEADRGRIVDCSLHGCKVAVAHVSQKPLCHGFAAMMAPPAGLE
jgi:hypothetical protein